jgi:uncharacterized membrane protein YvbJ
MAEIRCPECGSLAWDEQRSCPECGAVLPDREGTGDEFPVQERFAGSSDARMTPGRVALMVIAAIVVVLVLIVRERMMHPAY